MESVKAGWMAATLCWANRLMRECNGVRFCCHSVCVCVGCKTTRACRVRPTFSALQAKQQSETHSAPETRCDALTDRQPCYSNSRQSLHVWVDKSAYTGLPLRAGEGAAWSRHGHQHDMVTAAEHVSQPSGQHTMSGPRSIDVAVDVLSTLGAVFWSVQLIPQIIVNWRRKTGAGLQPSMMIAWALAGVPLGIHNILSRQPIALQVQAQILTSLSLLTWAQVMYYDHKLSLRRCTLLLAGLAIVLAIVEVAFVFGFLYGTHDQRVRQRAVLAMAILAALGLSFGVLRHYYDIYRHRTVRGIAWGFVLLDAAGDLTSLLSVTIRSPADRVAAAIYASELVLWIGILIAGLAFNFRTYVHVTLSHHHDIPAVQPDGQQTPQDPEPEEALQGAEHRPESVHSVSSAFSRVIPEVHRSSNWLMRRARRQSSH